MKTGLDLSELVQQIKRDADKKVKRDFLVNTSKIGYSNGAARFTVKDEGEISFPTNRIAEEQIASHTGIPQRYWDRMKSDAPMLLDINVDHWFRTNPQTRMLRTLHGNLRAFLSDRYRPLDNIDVALNLIPSLVDTGFEIKSGQVTDTNLYIQAVTRKITGEVKVGDVVNAGIVISNSEVGWGSLKIEPMIYRLVCSNGMIGGHSLRKTHLGRSMAGTDEFAYEMFSDHTKQLTDRAFWAQVNEVMKQATDQVMFDSVLKKMREASNANLEKPQDAVEIITKRFSMSESESTAILDNLIKGTENTRWGLVNAVTALSKDVESYDRSVELERIGGQVLELTLSDLSKN